MSILSFFRNHSHYWGVPHPRAKDSHLVQVCYECGAEREIKIELRPSAVERITQPYPDDHLAA